MRRLAAAVGVGPTLAALAVLALLALARLAPPSEPTDTVWGPVPSAWLHGLEVLRGGDSAGALAALAEAESRLAAAPPALLRARLHAALAAGDWVDAELTAEKLAVRTEAEALRSFVVGLAEYARSGRAAVEAEQPGADPTAFDRALRHATAAALAFQDASLASDGRDWPAARRNAERALIRRAELQRKKEQAERDAERERDEQPKEPDPDELEQIEQELRLAEDTGRLSPADLQAMLRRLAAAEDEKRALRRQARRARSAGVEQDW